ELENDRTAGEHEDPEPRTAGQCPAIELRSKIRLAIAVPAFRRIVLAVGGSRIAGWHDRGVASSGRSPEALALVVGWPGRPAMPRTGCCVVALWEPLRVPRSPVRRGSTRSRAVFASCPHEARPRRGAVRFSAARTVP